MRVAIPEKEFSSKKELWRYLVNNKGKLIEQKKSLPIESEPCFSGVLPVYTKAQAAEILKSNAFGAKTPVLEDVDSLRVKVVANTANLIDSHRDMILPGAPNKSIADRKGMIPHINGHIHTLDAKLGEVVDIFTSIISLQELGLDVVGSTEALIFITDIIKSYNEKVFLQYKADRVNQHSIGLQYVSLDLAINDPDSEKEMGFWNKYYAQVINKEMADEYGYFWVVPEYRLLENSAVLFGSNFLTPTLDNNLKSLIIEPEQSTQQKQPSADTVQKIKAYQDILNLFNN